MEERHGVENEIVNRAADAIIAGEGCVGGQLRWRGDMGCEGVGDESSLAIALQ